MFLSFIQSRIFNRWTSDSLAMLKDGSTFSYSPAPTHIKNSHTIFHVFYYLMFPATARKVSVTYYRIMFTLQEPKV